jgi:hypothetical protein
MKSERLNLLQEFWRNERDYTLSWAGDLYRWLLGLLSLGLIYRVLKFGETI